MVYMAERELCAAIKLNITTTNANGAKLDCIKTLSNATMSFGATIESMLSASRMVGSGCGYYQVKALKLTIKGAAKLDRQSPRSRRIKKRDKKPDEKRPRTAFTADQLSRLKQEFQENRYLTEKRRQDLARDLKLHETRTWSAPETDQIWFRLGIKSKAVGWRAIWHRRQDSTFLASFKSGQGQGG
ncbi:homeobox protein engrailed-like [Trichonephila clavata]|uniref:Homeobox protein engrailed-like n=1 Tax=Trichonephila clavata TaxID=2740835 RepID=A0A8X6GDB9_TRICU|nr:homeobox protein engrailed-like [Trichonephila clavata]